MKPDILTTKTRSKKSNTTGSTTSVTAPGILITENDNEELARFLEELQVSAFSAAKSKDDDFDDEDDDDFDDDFDDFDDDDLDLDDTDFEEFDMPKKSGAGKKKEDSDFELEEDFDDFDDFDDEDDEDDF